MTPAEFHAAYRGTADQVTAGTGIDPIALLAQWANETAWGVSWAGAPFNLANIESNGTVIAFPSLAAFAVACVATFRNGFYAAVLAATNAVDQLSAIVASPWAAGHYGGSLLAYYLPLEGFELTPQEDAVLNQLAQNVTDLHNGLLYGLGTPNPSNAYSDMFELKIRTIVQQELAKLPPGGSEPAEPPEPKTVTLNFPAQIITGSLG